MIVILIVIIIVIITIIVVILIVIIIVIHNSIYTRHNSTISAMLISVQTMNGKTNNFMMKPSDTIANLKTQIQDFDGIPADQQRLIFAGSDLENDKMLADYNIQNKSMLHLIVDEASDTIDKVNAQIQDNNKHIHQKTSIIMLIIIIMIVKRRTLKPQTPCRSS